MRYDIEYRIETIVDNAVTDEKYPPCFDAEGINFSEWDLSLRDGWTQKGWIARGEVDAPDFDQAYREFRGKLVRIIPRIALIGQCFIEYQAQPFLIRRLDRDFAFVRLSHDDGPVGLVFGDDELEALNILLVNKDIPEEFFYYWTDAVNVTGYSAKLVLMFAALEALVKKKDGDKDFAKLECILGSELKKDLWG
jgi:hypothetical protein